MTDTAPRTMTKSGLSFLQSLARARTDGCFLEVGPLFGSSTNAIARGRTDPNVPIHTIDTFEPAPWIKKRLGIDLSRAAFDGHTDHIENLVVHQGFAPDVVEKKWNSEIGFYFDDATHGDPGWTNNYNHFSPFFTPNAIICGDDFASGWPDIVRNVYDITEAGGWSLYVIGRVWAFTPNDEARIETAIHDAFPRLRDFKLEVDHGTTRHCGLAASWSWGLHRDTCVQAAHLDAPYGFSMRVDSTQRNGQTHSTEWPEAALSLKNVQRMKFDIPEGFGIQFCVRDSAGRTTNTKEYRSGSELALKSDDTITSMRLSHL